MESRRISSISKRNQMNTCSHHPAVARAYCTAITPLTRRCSTAACRLSWPPSRQRRSPPRWRSRPRRRRAPNHHLRTYGHACTCRSATQCAQREPSQLPRAMLLCPGAPRASVATNTLLCVVRASERNHDPPSSSAALALALVPALRTQAV